jgi:hypothetical protein
MGDPPEDVAKGAVAWFCLKRLTSFKMVIILLLSLVDDEKKYRRFAGYFNDHVDALMRCSTHCLIDHNQGFTRSHWTSASGNYTHRIAPARPPWSLMTADNPVDCDVTSHRVAHDTYLHRLPSGDKTQRILAPND